MTSQTYHYKKGANQQFCQISHVFDPTKYPEEDLTYSADREIIPIAIYCVVDEGQDGNMMKLHWHSLYLRTMIYHYLSLSLAHKHIAVALSKFR